ncbi:AraC family transcriptional regulator [Sphingopyxis sp. YF1]|nr:AraC family transcriptional regulator [Sphingopyxis sp. YF1]
MDGVGISAARIVDRIGGPESWTIESGVHALMLHEAGSYHRLETWLDGRRTSLGDPLPGELWLAPAGHHYRARAEGGAVRYVRVAIDPGLLPIGASARALASHRDPAMATLVRALADDDRMAADPLLTLLAAAVEGVPVARASARTEHRIDALLPLIEARIENPFTVEEMAAEAGMSVNSLIVHFSRATGRTPRQYLLRQRLRRACWYLMNRPLTVAEIAFATGFSSHAHLCAAFRDKLGLSPGEWRMRYAGVATTGEE